MGARQSRLWLEPASATPFAPYELRSLSYATFNLILDPREAAALQGFRSTCNLQKLFVGGGGTKTEELSSRNTFYAADDYVLPCRKDECWIEASLVCSAPRMSGNYLAWVLWLLDQPWSGPIWAKFMRNSGVPQVVREMNVPEPTTFMPLWPLPTSIPANEIILEGQVTKRLEAAAGCIPGESLPIESTVGLGPKSCSRADSNLM
jgi:hypothetical protein